MNLEAERAEAKASRRSVAEPSRHTVGRRDGTSAVAMMLLFALVALAGIQVLTVLMEREPSMALIGSGEPTIVERGVPPNTTSESSRDSRTGLSSAEERGQWALDQLSYPWEEKLPGWTVEFKDERDGLFGLTLVEDERIEIYVRDDQSDELLLHIVAHEIGHAVDVTLNSGHDRRVWQAARGIEQEPWWPDSAASDFRTGAGDFAESFAYWQAESDNFRSKLGPEPSREQLDLMAALAVD